MSCLAREAQRRRILCIKRLIDHIHPELPKPTTTISAAVAATTYTSTTSDRTPSPTTADTTGQELLELDSLLQRFTLTLRQTEPGIVFEAKHSRSSPNNDAGVLAKTPSTIRLLHCSATHDQAILDEPTLDDLLRLDRLSHILGLMVQAIDRSIDAISTSASEGFDRHTLSRVTADISTRCPSFKDQELWQTGTGRKTVWDPDADWSSDLVWAEMDVKQLSTHKPCPGSKLSKNYIPAEWSCSGTDWTASWVAGDYYSQWW